MYTAMPSTVTFARALAGQSGIVFVRDIVRAQATKSMHPVGPRSGKGGQAQRRTPAAVEPSSFVLDRKGESQQEVRA